jgi:hypothetical protein
VSLLLQTYRELLEHRRLSEGVPGSLHQRTRAILRVSLVVVDRVAVDNRAAADIVGRAAEDYYSMVGRYYRVDTVDKVAVDIAGRVAEDYYSMVGRYYRVDIAVT